MWITIETLAIKISSQKNARIIIIAIWPFVELDEPAATCSA